MPFAKFRRVRRVLPYAAALALAACGGSSSHKPASAPAAPQTPAQTQTLTTSSAPATTTATTTAQAGPQACRAADLALAFVGGQGATGHGELGFALRNTGTSSCSTGGYPGIQFLDRSGGALQTTPTHTTSDFFGTLPLAPVTVRPGESFSFRLGVSHGGGSSALCQTAYGLQVIPPNDTATLRVDIPGGASECGATTVSPVQPGTSAFH